MTAKGTICHGCQKMHRSVMFGCAYRFWYTNSTIPLLFLAVMRRRSVFWSVTSKRRIPFPRIIGMMEMWYWSIRWFCMSWRTMSAPPAPREAICTRSYLCLADQLSDLCSGKFDQLFSLQAAGDDIGAADRGHRSFPQGINHISLYAVFESISLTFHRKLASLFHKMHRIRLFL